MYKTFTVDMTNLTTANEIATYMQENLSDFSHLFTTGIDSEGYLRLYPVDCEYNIRLEYKKKGSSSYITIYANGTSNNTYSSSYTMNADFNLSIYTNEDNKSFYIVNSLFTGLGVGVVTGNDTKKYVYFSGSYIKTPNDYYGLTTLFYQSSVADPNKCYMFNAMRKEDGKIYDPPFIDLFSAVFPVYTTTGMTFTIDNEKYLACRSSSGTSYGETTLFKYTE